MANIHDSANRSLLGPNRDPNFSFLELIQALCAVRELQLPFVALCSKPSNRILADRW
jgi:hypothetical protein